MNNKKKTLLGVAFIASLIVLAGVGYAAHTGYTGSATGTQAQTYDVDYVVVKFNGNTAYTTDTTFYMTWNTATQYNAGEQTVTYTWQASDALVHELVITATDTGSDTYKLRVSVPAAPNGYALYYKLSSETAITPDSKAQWTPYTGSPLAATEEGQGETITPGAIGSTDVSTTISWALVPTTEGTVAPGTTSISIGTMTYTVEGIQQAA